MKKLIITAILCMSALFSAKGQTVFTCEYRTEAKKKIYFVNYRNDSDLVIYFTHYRNEAGWRNEKKEHLMEE